MKEKIHKILVSYFNVTSRYVGNESIKIYVIINESQKEILMEYISKNDPENFRDMPRILARIQKKSTAFVLRYGRRNKTSIAKLLYPDGPLYWDHDQMMINKPSKHPYLVESEDTTYLPDDEELIYDFRPENILISNINKNVERKFYCDYHKDYTPIENKATSDRCIECQYKYELLRASAKQAKNLGLEFELKSDVDIPESEKEYYKDSHFYSPKKLVNLYLCGPTHCFITGNEIKYSSNAKGYKASLTRIDPEKGYTEENSIIVSYAAALTKRNTTFDKTIDFYKNLKKINKSDELQPLSYEDLTSDQIKKLRLLIYTAKNGDLEKGYKLEDSINHCNKSLFDEVLKTNYICAITGTSLYITKGSLNMISIDKIDFELPHSNDNIHIVS